MNRINCIFNVQSIKIINERIRLVPRFISEELARDFFKHDQQRVENVEADIEVTNYDSCLTSGSNGRLRGRHRSKEQ